ncbi:GNAT family N-acetyltransferase [Aquihabitans sp. McL0605]|uniref:GNAT family N-acetyltransferase n=1 Tax=Aquihabitans sp. McL0605 TaxID=3415671 RepID=UPI003CF18737
MDIEIIDERQATLGQYRLLVDGVEVGELDHRTSEGIRTFTHTGVRPEFEGRGLAARLARRGLDDARADGVKVIPRCWYIARYIDQHPDDADLLAVPS